MFVHNLAPGPARRLALDVPSVRAHRPQLVACAISGFGDGGPMAGRKAYDLLVQAEAGVLDVTGTPDQPSKVGFSVADIAAAMYAYSGILAALLRRATTGAGGEVQVSMLECVAEWMSAPLYHVTHGGLPFARTGARHASIAPYGPIPTADGSVLLIGIQNQREWRRLCEEVLGRPTLADDPRFATNAERIRHVEELDDAIAETTRAEAEAVLVARLDSAQVAWARMRTVEELARHPQLRERSRFAGVGVHDVQLEALRAVTDPGDHPPSRVPSLGEHTDDVLAWAGIDDTAKRRLRVAGALG